MKLVSYAGQQVVTTDDVADALVNLAASLASEGESAAVQIPIDIDGQKDTADLIVGVGNDLLVGPKATDGEDPDFSADAAALREHRYYPKASAAEDPVDGDGLPIIDLDLDPRV
ncbi:hypothetical protein [Microbacterium paraoxydans]|uniref:Uncharacterized protein n=1 Tax=Microbacterium paraoxydans TaxID=199592 RepID=A0ABS5IJ00_9MICO|nr:hypothetical protein [Microbacterium paraoxydans]MBS0022914.1 hypothetical protein [Microbacterium paraoxydans]